MKKFAICCLVLAVAVMFVPAAQAAPAPKCITLSAFCDQLQHKSFLVGGQTGKLTLGLWDWTCDPGALATPISGKAAGAFGKTILATQPVAGGFPFGIQTHFSLNNATGLFDLYGSFDDSTFFAFQLSMGFTQAPGACPLFPGLVKNKPPVLGLR